jgi:subtilisin family serine protease
VIAGVIDSGIDVDGPEFAGRISNQSADFAGTRGLQDEDGHGTAVSAVLLGAKNDVGTHGVAFNATLLVLRTD